MLGDTLNKRAVILAAIVTSAAFVTFGEQMEYVANGSISVRGGNRIGTISLKNAYYRRVNPADHASDIIIVYSNVANTASCTGFLKLGDSENNVWANAHVLVVGGGGGGGFYGNTTSRTGGGGAGGGAGGFVEKDGLIFDSTDSFDIVIGEGGAGSTTSKQAGVTGGDSSLKFSSTSVNVVDVAKGGGGGGAQSVGLSGGSGGGGSRKGSTYNAGGTGTDGQGNAGGLGSNNTRGGGGGGAGGAGYEAVMRIDGIVVGGAPGGIGKASSITGIEQWFAGGGGGSLFNLNSMSNTSSKKYKGGDGGKGGGGNGGGVQSGDEAECINGYWTGSFGSGEFNILAPQAGIDGTGGGGGGGGCYANSTATSAATTVADTNYGGRGGSGIVIIRLSGFVVGTIPFPVPKMFVYNGEERQTVEEFFAYTLAGTWKATDADVYSFSATIPDTAPYTWDDGTRGKKDFVWKITPLPVDVPEPREDLVFGDPTRTEAEEKTAIDSSAYSLDAEGFCYTNSLKYCRLTGHKETNAGTYTFTASLYTTTKTVGAETVMVTNFVWKPFSSTEDRIVQWHIAQAENAISDLQMEDWQEGLVNSEPKCSWQWSSISSDKVVYTFAKSDTRPLFDSDYDITEIPTEAGVYWVRAFISKDSAHDPGNWVSAKAYKRFCIWRHPSKVFADYVDITVSGYAGSTTRLEDFPVLVRLEEAKRDSTGAVKGGIPGFRYASIISSDEIRFVSVSNLNESAVADADRANPLSRDSLLPYEVERWNTKGQSLVWVKLPVLVGTQTKFRMYWNRRGREEVKKDLLSSDTWNDGYVAVWHFNSKNGTKIANSTSLGAALDATGVVSIVSAKAGMGAKVDSGSLMAPSFEQHISNSGRFTISGYYKLPEYNSGTIMFAGTKLGGQTTNPHIYTNGWCWVVPNNKTRFNLYTSGNAAVGDWSNLSDITANFHLLTFYCPQYASGTKYTYVDGSSNPRSSNGKSVFPNGRAYQIAGKGVIVDEVRLSDCQRTTIWQKAEYDSVNNQNFCSFGLVNRLLEDGVSRAWVNYWTKEPVVSEFVEVGTLKASDVVSGVLAVGTVGVSYTEMPEEKIVDFAHMNTNTGPYLVRFFMNELEQGTLAYPGLHSYFDGDRTLELEVIRLKEITVDPDGAGATASGRVLLGNDDLNAADPVTNQSYWVWEHHNSAIDAGLSPYNLLPGTEHSLAVRGGASAWHLKDVYIGNTMLNDHSGTLPATTPVRMTLPWSSTSLNTASNESYSAQLTPNEVAHFVMRNNGGSLTSSSGAQIVSPLYTNGIGTVYFDAVNSSATNSAAFELVVEISTNLTDGVGEDWQRLTELVSLTVNGSVVSPPVTNDLVSLDFAVGGKSAFRRVYAPVRHRAPVRFRIRRVSELTEENGEVLPDLVDAFIILDNIIASPATADVALTPYGWCDEKKTGSQVLGVETAFNVDYPKCDEENLLVRARLAPGTDPSLISSARCYYRWRYLNSNFDPERLLVDNDYRAIFKTMYLDPAAGMQAIRPLELNGIPGDIEFYFKATAIVPYYVYVDYSGSALAKPLGGYYSEHVPEGVVSRRDGGNQASSGSDWFVRLREGKSDYSSLHIYYRGAETNRADMVLVGDNLWRGFVRTKNADPSGIEYRFEALRPGVPGAVEKNYVTNFWKASGDTSTLPFSPVVTEAAKDEWSKVPCDATTGYIMFQIDDNTKSITISHADYQNFNSWSDAWSNDGMYRGNSIELGKRTGVSGKMMRVSEDFSTWTDTPETKANWIEGFDAEIDNFAPGYQPFDAAISPNGWSVANGMWVGRFYHPIDVNNRARSGMALQLSGTERGYIELINLARPPRGIDKVTFKARVGQRIDFDAMSYADLGLANATNECTFVTRVTFDENKNRNFAGSATASVIINYQPGVGCYEARLEQLNGAYNTQQNSFNGADAYSHRLSLYRWATDEDENVVCTLLGAITNNVNATYRWNNAAGTGLANYNVNTTGGNRSLMPETTETTRAFMPMLISAKTLADGTTEITAGIWSQSSRMTASATDYASKKWNVVYYRDTSENHPTKGYYGVQSANSEVYFNQPATFNAAVRFTNNNLKYSHNQFACAANLLLTFEGEYRTERENLAAGAWTSGKNRHRVVNEGDTEYGIKAVSPSVKLDLYLGSSNGEAATEKFGTRVIDGFGQHDSDGKEYSFVVRSVSNRSVKLAAAKSSLGDVVLTDLKLSQWAGDTYGDVNGDTLDFVYYDDGYGIRTNVVFTSGIIKDNKVKLSARRTKSGYPSSIRSPLFDGEYSGGVRRGIGLGMLSLTYENAQENVNLLIQIATNRVSTDIRDITESTNSTGVAGTWTTVTNIDFSVMSSSERRRGVISHYFGLHGAKGLMRVIIDPAVVDAVADSSDEKAFGEIEITKFVCRDEPDLDNSDWWGWNLRTLSPGSDYDGGLRTYLPDGDVDADAAGMSLALNNSTVDMVPSEDAPIMGEHMPFVQTPTFVSNIVGEISFRARKYDIDDESQHGEVQLYGATSGLEGDDAKWTPLHRFVISNTTYRTYSFRAASSYSAFRLGIVGVEGVTYHNGEERETYPASRVLIDEIMVFEAVHPTMGFRYVYPFRDGIDKLTLCTNVVDAAGNPLPSAQPIAGEDWTVQAQIEKRQLPDEIDLESFKPQVLFYWYSGGKWGFSNWREDAVKNGNFGRLTRVEGEDLVFRGSLAVSSDAIVKATTEPPEIIQYSAEIIYRSKSGTIRTNTLNQAEWKIPPWYRPLDYNKLYSKWNSFSAYTVIDTIAPGRVWINEANVFDNRSPNYVYFADTNQYVEVASPERQSIEGWRLEYISNNEKVHTLCTFSKNETGFGYAPAVKDLSGVPLASISDYRTNDYVFLTVRSPQSRQSGAWDHVPAAVDGTWSNFDEYDTTLNQTVPIALRLVRPSGIVEQEIVLEGTNQYANGRYAHYYSATNWMVRVKDLSAGKLYYSGNEYGRGNSDSLGVVSGTGSVSNDWSNSMVQTPGRLNAGQIIPEGYVVYPNGAMMVIRSRIGASGHIMQAFGDDTPSASEIVTFVKKGGEGTNITYTVADWWETAGVTTNGVVHQAATGKRGVYSINVGAGQSNDVTVVASAVPFSELATQYGLTADNRYTLAVMDWLERGRNYFGESFAHPGNIVLTEFRLKNNSKIRDLTLTEMYWLDIDPTTNWVLKAQVSKVGGPIVLDDPPPAVTNFRMTVHMEITNENTSVAYSPYILRGVEPGSTSDLGGVWTSATFKITGDLQGGPAGRQRWIPLRWFVFAPDRTKKNLSASFDDNHEAVVDIWDPKDEANAIWTSGWSSYPDPVWYRWAIDDRNAPVEIETLRPDSKYSP